MRYTVNWKTAAQDDLASLWLAADATARRAITTASHAIDRLLLNDPDQVGESRPRRRRIVFVAPLAVIFQVVEADRRVDVLTVRLIARR